MAFSSSPLLHVEGLSKSYTDGMTKKRVLIRTNLDVERGETVVLVGASGAGKTTLLNIIAGLVAPDDGLVSISGEVVERAAGKRGDERVSIPPELRSIGYVPQNYVLFPFLTVYANVAFGLKGRLAKRELRSTVDSLISTLELEGVSHLRPGQLSGGQRQRVALARALAVRPKLLLMDEPLASLDESLRGRVREEIRGFLSSFDRTTVLYVTHDLDDAFSLGDRVAVLIDGKIAGAASPMNELLNSPPSIAAGRFLGLNCYRGRMVGSNQVQVEGRGIRFLVSNDDGGDGHEPERKNGSEVLISIRPDSVRIPGESSGAANALVGHITSVYEGKDIVRLTVDAEIRIECCLLRREYEEVKKMKPGDQIGLYIDPHEVRVVSCGVDSSEGVS